ncbi:peroxide stress protein YaaA [Algivirga pacifica]|uniref:UPF0246 protein GCM10023331_08420 n=1 Tax=Algivirga pacifica TaxID=1162670 RepID=A0ABP9D2K9_9BACT
MKMVISPAKSLDYSEDIPSYFHTKPDLMDKSAVLIEALRKIDVEALQSLMGISENLAVLNKDRYATWSEEATTDNARQAIYAFKGDVYQGFDVEGMSEEDLQFAQEHLRILSGLYGLLRPMDLMQPYRLEMGTKLTVGEHKNLYEYWGDLLTTRLNEVMEEGEALVNLASNEYFKSIKKKQLKANIITPVFKDFKNDKYKVISFFAKKARGMMVAYAVKNRITNPEDLKGFNAEGYTYNEELSKANEWVFVR